MEMKIEDSIYDIRWRHERCYLGIDYIPNREQKEMLGFYKDNVATLPTSSNGGRTVAYILDAKGKPIEAYAECSIKDAYNKHLGRIIATGRLLKILGLNTKEACKL